MMEMEDMGRKHGKYDVERMGLFSEGPYLTGQKYKQPNPLKGVRDMRKSQMYPGILKTKTGLQDAYFDQEFKRLFENERWRPPVTSLHIRPLETKKRNKLKTAFKPSSYTKVHSTPGDYYGTFGPKLEAMSNLRKTPKRIRKVRPNVMTAPTNTRGPGYTDICLNPFPAHITCPYDEPKILKKRNKGKKKAPFIAGCKPGGFFEKNPYYSIDIEPMYPYEKKPKKISKRTPFRPPSKIVNIGKGFEKWPEHHVERYIDPYRIGRTKAKRNKNQNPRKFYPQARNKTSYTTSIVQRKLKNTMNNTNWHAFNTVTFPVVGYNN